MKTQKFKRGQLSSDEKTRIEKLCMTKTDEEISRILRRPVETIEKYRKVFVQGGAKISVEQSEALQYRDELHNHPQWSQFKQQFDDSELIMFEDSYVDLISQFKSDILPTERKQIFQAITLEIFIHRHNKERMEAIKDIKRLQNLLDEIYSHREEGELDKSDANMAFQLEQQIEGIKQSSMGKTKEYKDLSDKFSNIIKELKGTREQRIQKATEGKQSFVGLLRELQEEERKERVGKDLLIMEEGVQKELDRLSSLHEYADGSVEPPFLNCDTIMNMEEEK